MKAILHRVPALVLIALCGLPAVAGGGYGVLVSLDRGSGSVEFHAIGHPSALKIVGKGSAPKGNFRIDGRSVNGTASFALSSLDTGIDLRNRHMKEKYLEIEKYPEAKLTVTRMMLPRVPQGDLPLAQVPFTGTLSLHGVEHPVSGMAQIAKSGDRVSIDARFSLKIGEFRIREPSFAGISMADEVQVVVQSMAPISSR